MPDRPERGPDPSEAVRSDRAPDGNARHGTAGSRREAAAGENLDEALAALEGMLDRRDAPVDTQTEGEASDEPGFGDGVPDQYSIPLLDHVVIPAPAGERAASTGEDLAGDLAADAAYRQVIERLTSEIEIIVQSGVEQALQQATDRIVQRVRNHVAITLPEILDEMVRLKAEREP